MKYKNEDWFKKLQYKYPEQAEYLDDAYSLLDTKAYNAAASIRTLLEANIECIGELERKKKLKEALSRKGKHDLSNRINKMKQEKIISEDTCDVLHSIRKKGNKVHEGARGLEAQKLVLSAINEMESYLIWFTDKYIEDEIENEVEDVGKTITIKYCSNKKQCGRIYHDGYPYHICQKCGALIEQMEKINDEGMDPELEIPETLNHYILIGYNNNNNYELKDKINLDSEQIIIGRESNTSDFKVDIDLTKYIDNEEYHREISRKHAMIYKKDNTLYIKKLSKHDNLTFLNKNSEEEIIIKENESRELNEDELILFSNYLICIEYLVDKGDNYGKMD